ncbi:phage tail tape measure C-terminal domain-containing protein [uncultured Cohaesibacter sp.]|uniref:phage tail tape measure C-terminal domain-containing protein n=1 Tax=uncultured Cohaesibacter sp. TaxID=1002546 RepID=UPI0029C8911C|nr:phage tail tape measure C-terminal domain-containing protein [uncultured Cohaesibacter sp.]
MANRDAGSISVRLSVKDQDTVRRALQKFGKEGETALKKIDAAGKPASKGLKAVSAASQDLKSSAEGLNSRLGVTGGILRSLGPAGLAAGAAMGALLVTMESLRRAGVAAAESLAALNGEAQVAGLDVESYQEFEYVAAKLSISQDALVDGFKELQLRAQEFAQRGAGTAKESFEELGYTQDAMREKLKDTPALFLEIIDKVGKLDKAAQIFSLDEIFGGTAAEHLVKMVNAGTDSMRDMISEARSLGVVIDEHIVQSGADATRQFKTLQTVIDRNLDQALVDLAPLAISVAEAFAFVARQVRELIDGIRDLEAQSTSSLKSQMSSNTARQAELEAQIGRGQSRLEQGGTAQNKRRLSAQLSRLQSERDDLIAQNKEIEKVLNSRQKPASSAPTELPGESQDLVDKRKRFLDSIYRNHLAATNQRVKLIEMERDKQLEALDQQGLGAEEYARVKEQILGTASAKIAALHEKETASSSKLNEAQREGMRIIEATRTPMEQYAATVAQLDALLAKGTITQQAYNRALAEANDELLDESKSGMAGALRGLNQYADEATNAGAQIEDALSSAFGGLEDILVDFATTGKLSAKDMVDSMLADFTRLTVRQTITGPLAAAFSGVLGGGGGFLAGILHSGGMVGQGSSVSRAVNPAVFAGAPRFHGGGKVSDGLRPGERAIIAEDDERILTRAQQRSTADTLRSLSSIAGQQQSGGRQRVEVVVTADRDGMNAYIANTVEEKSTNITAAAMQQTKASTIETIEKKQSRAKRRGF